MTGGTATGSVFLQSAQNRARDWDALLNAGMLVHSVFQLCGADTRGLI